MTTILNVGDKENEGTYIETGKQVEDKDRSKSRTKSRSEEKKERMVGCKFDPFNVIGFLDLH